VYDLYITIHNTFLLQCDSCIVAENIREHAEHMVRSLSLNGFKEASAKDGHQVEDVFETALTLVRIH